MKNEKENLGGPSPAEVVSAGSIDTPAASHAEPKHVFKSASEAHSAGVPVFGAAGAFGGKQFGPSEGEPDPAKPASGDICTNCGHMRGLHVEGSCHYPSSGRPCGCQLFGDVRDRRSVMNRLEVVYCGVMADSQGRVSVSRDLVFDAIQAIRASDKPEVTLDEALFIGRNAIVHSTLPAVHLWHHAADVVTHAVYDALTGGNQAGAKQGPVTPAASAAP